MAYDFPSSPTIGQIYNNWTWDGEKWATNTATTGAVRYDTPQGLTAAQQTQGRQNIYAAPFDAMAYSGMQINGSMEVSQELGAVGRTTAGYSIDGWIHAVQGTATSGIGQAVPGSFPGFAYCLQGNIGTAQPSLGSSDYLLLYQPIEGYRISRLAWGTANAQPITIGFWSAHNPAGVYSVVIANGPTTHTYCTPYTQAVAGVSQYNVVTIPGPTVGTWKKDNTVGAYLYFARAVGSGGIASAANTWLAGGPLGVPGQVNAAVAGSTFTLTGVVVLPGIEAPSAARSALIMRPYDQELVTCKRYYYRQIYGVNFFVAQMQAVSTTAANGYLFRHPFEMRSGPSAAVSSPAHFSFQPAAGGSNALSVFTINADPISCWLTTSTVAGGLAAGNATAMLANTTNAWISMDARL
jgi:hypothetical protein